MELWNCMPKAGRDLKKGVQINGAFCFHLPSSPALPRSSFLVSSFRPVPQPNLLLYKQG